MTQKKEHHPITAELRASLEKMQVKEADECDPDSQRITVTAISSKLPAAGKIAAGVLQTLPDRHRAGVVKWALVVGGIVVGAVVGWAIARGYKL